MRRNLLISEDQTGMRLTELGQACGQLTLGVESCLRVIEDLRSSGLTALSPEAILAVTQSLPESHETYVPIQKKSAMDYHWPSIAASRLGNFVSNWFHSFVDSKVAAAQAKRTLIALDWAHGSPIEQIESTYTKNPFAPVRRATFGVSTNRQDFECVQFTR